MPSSSDIKVVSAHLHHTQTYKVYLLASDKEMQGEQQLLIIKMIKYLFIELQYYIQYETDKTLTSLKINK